MSYGTSSKKCTQGVPWWFSRLRTQHGHCYGSGCCCGPGLIPSPGRHTMGAAKKRKKKKIQYVRKAHVSKVFQNILLIITRNWYILTKFLKWHLESFWTSFIQIFNFMLTASYYVISFFYSKF